MNATTTQQPILSYAEVFETVSIYAPKVQTLFADAWSRFPQGDAREIVIAALEEAADFYTRSPVVFAGEKYTRCKQAADTVRHYNA